jgi:transmembrane sensor
MQREEDIEDIESIFDQAERWFVRLRAQNCSMTDRQEFDAWQAADPAHAAAYAETSRLWVGLSSLADDQEIATWRREAVAAPRGGTRFNARCAWGRLAWGSAIAACLFLVAALVGYRVLRNPPDTAVTRHYATAHGEIRQVALLDGSSVTLNVDTMLDVTIGQHARTVQLTKGEAVFEVAHEPQRPFIVHAAGNIIQDIGTRFDVNLAGSQTDITVVEGIVQVTRQDQSATLTHGDRLVAGSGVWHQRRIAPEVAIGWTQGKLVFRETPLGEAVAQVNSHGPGHLVITDPSLENLPISGDFRIGQTASLVRALQSTFPIRARVDKVSGDIQLSRR